MASTAFKHPHPLMAAVTEATYAQVENDLCEYNECNEDWRDWVFAYDIPLFHALARRERDDIRKHMYSGRDHVYRNKMVLLDALTLELGLIPLDYGLAQWEEEEMKRFEKEE